MAKRTCSMPECEGEHAARGLCHRHYQAAHRSGEIQSTGTPHRVVNIDDGAQVGDCLVCGLGVPVQRFGGRMRCLPGVELKKAADRAARQRERADPERLARLREYHKVYGREQTARRLGYASRRSLLDTFARRCGSCETALTVETMRVDHDHACCPGPITESCGECVRGILCQSCNTGMGLLGDTVAGLMQAVAYLERYRDTLQRRSA